MEEIERVLKHLKPKDVLDQYEYSHPDPKMLDTFPNPGVDEVTLHCHEFTSLCPITGQPDYGEIKITYEPRYLCLESKSLKLYLGQYRQHGGFAEQITVKIYTDLFSVLHPMHLKVESKFTSRGGIGIEAYRRS